MAFGFIETQGRAALVEAVDIAIKAAQVKLAVSYCVGGGCNAVVLTGDVGSMRAALEAAEAYMRRGGVSGITHLIPRPAVEVENLIRLDAEKDRKRENCGTS
jgi:microcompartment protein CcmL/EutN